MDHLKWIWNLQEMASDGNLPEFLGTRVFRKEAESSAAGEVTSAETADVKTMAAGKTAVEELFQRLALAEEAASASRLLRNKNVTETGESTVVFSSAADGVGSAAAYTVGGQVGVGGLTMDEISRFFEIDARRF